jgi:hypothetical protein
MSFPLKMNIYEIKKTVDESCRFQSGKITYHMYDIM